MPTVGLGKFFVYSFKKTRYISITQEKFRYLRLSQGLSSSPEIFETEMCRILAGIDGGIIHMDDVPVV